MREKYRKQASIKFPMINQRLSPVHNNNLNNKSLRLEKMNRPKKIALIDIAKINKIEKQFKQITQRHQKNGETIETRKDEMRQSKLLLLKNITPQPIKKGNQNLLSNLVQYNNNNVNQKKISIPSSNINFSPMKIKKIHNKIKKSQNPICSYTNPQQLQKVDFVRMFIVEELLYYISKTNERIKDEMAGFCKFYNQNTNDNDYLIISKCMNRQKQYLNAIFYEKIGFYVFLILGTDNELEQQAHFLLNSVAEYIHKNNLIILDILMEIIDQQKLPISTQFHVYNTSRFNQDRRKLNHNEDSICLLQKNNSSLVELIHSILRSCEFDSLKNFVAQILNNQQVHLFDKIKQVNRMLISLDSILTNSIQQYNQKPIPPFLPAKQKNTPYTLVLDMDQTLIHYKQIQNLNNSFLIRPYCQAFLNQMNKYYEIIIFTAAVKQYADSILDAIDQQGRISHRLYRQHTRIQDYVSIKDLSLINRDLSKTIIVDNIASNFKLQPRNGISISTWTGQLQDTSLLNLIPVLKKLAIDEVIDVRDSLEILSQFMENKIKKQQQIHFEDIDLKKQF